MGKKNKGNKNRGSLGDDFEDSYSYDSDDDSYQDYGRSNKKNKRNRNRGNDSYDDYGYDSYSNGGDYDSNYYDDSYDGYDDYEEEAEDEEQEDTSLNDERQDDSSDSNYSYSDASSHGGYSDSSYSDSSNSNSFQQKKPSPLAGMHPAKAVPSFSNASASSASSAKNSFAGGGTEDRHVSSHQESAPVFKPVTPVVTSHSTPSSNSYTRDLSNKTNINGDSFNSALKNQDETPSVTEENVEEDFQEEKPTGGVLSRLFHRKTERKNVEAQENIEEESTTSSSDVKEEEAEQNADKTSENEDDELKALKIEELENSLLKIEQDIHEYEEMLASQDVTDSEREEIENDIEKLQEEKKSKKQELRELQKSSRGEGFKKLKGVVLYPFTLLSKIPQLLQKKDVEDEESSAYDDSKDAAQEETKEDETVRDDVSSEEDDSEEPRVRDWRRIAYRTTGVTIVVTVLLACGYVGYLFLTHGHATSEEEVVASSEIETTEKGTETVEKEKAPGFFDRMKAKFRSKSNKSGQGEELANDDSNASSKAKPASKSGGNSGVTEPAPTPKMAQMDSEKQDGLISDDEDVNVALSTPLPSEVSGVVTSRTASGVSKSGDITDLSIDSPSDSDLLASTETDQSVGAAESSSYSEDLDDLSVSNTSLPESVEDDLTTYSSQSSTPSSSSSSTPTAQFGATSKEDDEDALIDSQIDPVELAADDSPSSNDLTLSTSEDLGVDPADDLTDHTATTPRVSNNEPSLDDTLAIADNNANSTPSGAQWGSDDSSSWNSTASSPGNSIESVASANELQSSQLGGSEDSSLASNNSLSNSIIDDDKLDNSFGSSTSLTEGAMTLEAEPSNLSLRSLDNPNSTASSLTATTSLQETPEEAAPLTSLAAPNLGAGEADASRASLSLSNGGLLEDDETSGTDLDLHLGDSSNVLWELTEESDLNELSGAGASLTNDYSSVAENFDSAAGRSSLTSAAGNGGASLNNALSRFEDRVDDAVQGINDVAQGVRGRIDSLTQAVEDGQNRFSEQGEAIADSVNNSLTSLSNSLESSRNTIIEGGNNLIETVGDAYESSVNSLKNTGNSLRSNLQGLQSSLGIPENSLSESPLSDGAVSLGSSSSSDDSLTLIQEETDLPNSTLPESTDNSLQSLSSSSRESSSSPISLRGNGGAVNSNLLLEEAGGDVSSAQSISGLGALANEQNLLETSSSQEGSSLSPSLTGNASTPRLASSGSSLQTSETPQRISAATSLEEPVGLGSGSNDVPSQPSSTPSAPPTDNSLVDNKNSVFTSRTEQVTNSTKSAASPSTVTFGRTGVRKRLQSSVMTTAVSGDVGANGVSSGYSSTMGAVAFGAQGTSNRGGQNPLPSISTGNSAFTNSVASSNVSPSSDEYRVYVTKEGDNLLTIAQNELGSSSRWGEIRRINNLRSGAAYFEAGTRLLLPLSTSSGN